MEKAGLSTVTHTIKPIYDENSRALILGTMPSPKSREAGFFYGHPQNSFWRVMAAVFGVSALETNAQKTAFLLENRIALWDVLRSCDISGAADGSIRNPVANDFSAILNAAAIKAVYTTGITATKLYKKLCLEQTGIPAVCLPSTSPANRGRCGFDELVERYTVIAELLKDK